jgi:uncharacterized protein (DUF736 family)
MPTLADATAMRAPANYLRVSLDDPAEAEYWSVVLDAPRARIAAALAAIGSDAGDVRDWLRGLRVEG